ncbi:transcriptional repressor p66-beta [Clonorchis sinensis]|uniref:Transcriptional repressor p66-beta n=1 Tax=Clonorchis sinensis TaxID=79923 RepID=G7Y590_CLOSI|nr:transcriptional repressor p66-beta [Clonorchis sinensis]
MPQCCFAGCHNRTDDGRGLSFFRFPRRDVARTENWVLACGRERFVPSQHSRVCSQHFKPEDFERDIRSELLGTGHRRMRLKDTAVPTKAQNTVTVNQTTLTSTSTKDEQEENRFKPEVQAEKRKAEVISSKQLEPPSKRYECHNAKVGLLSPRSFVDETVLDLSRKASTTAGTTASNSLKGEDDVILLSEDEDEAMLDALCEEMEKENAPSSDLALKSKALLRRLENELRNEESTLLLLQQLRANQRSNSLPLKGNKASGAPPNISKSAPSTNQSRSAAATPTRVPVVNHASRTPQTPSSTASSSTNGSTPSSSLPKVTKAMALQTLEQQYSGKKSTLQKHLGRALDKVTLPRPPSGTGLSEVAFVPSTLTNEFTALLGLEETVSALQDFDAYAAEKADQSLACEPFVCSRCQTDFTPVWKRRRPGSSEVVCEACIVDSQRSAIHKSYHNSVNTALKQHAASEREIEHEYQDILNTPNKLEAFIKDQERKLSSTHQQQQQQHTQQQSQVVSAAGQRYQQPPAQQQQSFQSQSTFSGSRHPQTTTVNNATAVHFTIPNVNARRQNPNTLVTSASAPSLSIHQQQQQQLASQYQQLSKVVAAVAAGNNQAQSTYSVNTNPVNVTAGLMMAAAANPMLLAAAAANASRIVYQLTYANTDMIGQRNLDFYKTSSDQRVTQNQHVEMVWAFEREIVPVLRGSWGLATLYTRCRTGDGGLGCKHRDPPLLPCSLTVPSNDHQICVEKLTSRCVKPQQDCRGLPVIREESGSKDGEYYLFSPVVAVSIPNMEDVITSAGCFSILELIIQTSVKARSGEF